MSTTDAIKPFETDQAALSYTQLLRKRMVEENLLGPDGATPTNKDQQELLLRTLDSMDRQALAKSKIIADNENEEANRRVALMAAKLNAQVKVDPFQSRGAVGEIPDIDLPEVALVPGETDIGISSENVTDFVSRAGG